MSNQESVTHEQENSILNPSPNQKKLSLDLNHSRSESREILQDTKEAVIKSALKKEGEFPKTVVHQDTAKSRVQNLIAVDRHASTEIESTVKVENSANVITN